MARLLGDGVFGRLGVKPERFEFQRARGLVVHVSGAPTAVFGDSHDFAFKVAVWQALNERLRGGQVKATEIDLRFGRELVVR